MLVYDKAYMELKSKYLLPLTAYSVPYSHLRKTNIKNAILTKWTSVDRKSDAEYIFHFDKDYLLKALLGDIELFYVRKVIQKKDSDFCKGDGISANWNIVTNYYNAFFTASLMLRLCHRGNVFLDAELKTSLEQLVSNVTNTLVKLESNQFYEVEKVNEKYVLRLTRATDATHELVWRKMDSLLDEMTILSRSKSDEKTILSAIKHINSSLKSTFPSQLRNRVNYQTVYGLEHVDRKLYQLNESIDWIKCLLGFSGTTNDNQIACYMYAYTKYMEYFCSNFIAEYYDIRGKENGILKAINANQNHKIENDKLRFVFY